MPGWRYGVPGWRGERGVKISSLNGVPGWRGERGVKFSQVHGEPGWRGERGGVRPSADEPADETGVTLGVLPPLSPGLGEGEGEGGRDARRPLARRRHAITMQVGVGQEPEAYLTQQRTTLAYEQNYTPLIDSSQGSRAANEDADYGPSRPIRSHSNAVAYPVAPRSRVPKARARPHQSPYEFTPLG